MLKVSNRWFDEGSEDVEDGKNNSKWFEAYWLLTETIDTNTRLLYGESMAKRKRGA
jgi:hypothetical protein